jgi:hypothetical protein
MNDDQSQTSRGYSGAFILIILGVLFLLSNFGALPWSVWEIIVRFWPIVLILIGLEVLVGGTILGNIIFGFIGLLFFAGIVIFGLWLTNIQKINQWFSQIGLDFLRIKI